MASCRIHNLKPPCGYQVDGLARIQLLDYDDFVSFRFFGDDLYGNCLVTAIQSTGEYVEIEAPETAKYTSPLQNGVYTHTIETFVNELSANVSAQLHLASKRRYMAVFTTSGGRRFVFGYEAGATVSYVNQTEGGTGALITITAVSTYPLFEYIPIDIACTWGDFINIWEYRELTVSCTWGDFINIWKATCANDFNMDFSKDFNCNSPAE